jgi:hypothetical protein
MLQAAAKYNNSYATGYIHQMAWTKTGHQDTIVYARIAGKPTFVKALAGSLYRGNYIRVQFEKEAEYLYGSEEAKCLYHKIDKIGIATYFSTSLFNPNKGNTYIIGHSQEQIDRAFTAILKRKPLCFLESWPMKRMLANLNLIDELQTYNIRGYEVLWDEEKIMEHISGLVKSGKLRF